MQFRVFSSSILLAGVFGYAAAGVSIMSQIDLQNPLVPYSNATCHSDYNWAENSKKQNPCLVIAYLLTACSANSTGEVWHVDSLDSSPGCYPYTGPYPLSSFFDFVESPCACSSVIYELLSACGACQGRPYVSWNNYTTNCVDFSTSLGSIPTTIPPETAVPSWAFQDPTQNNGYFNPTLSKQIGDSSENTPPSGSLASGPNPPPSSGCTSGPKASKAGAIAGGVVGGTLGIAAVAVVGWLVATKLAVAAAAGGAGSAGGSGASGTQVPLIGDPTGGAGAAGGHAAGFGANGAPFLPDSGAGAGFGSGVAGAAGAAPGVVAGGAGTAAGAGAAGTGASAGAGVVGGGGGPGLLPYLALLGFGAGRRRKSRENQYVSQPPISEAPEMSTYSGAALITEGGSSIRVAGPSNDFNAPVSADSPPEDRQPGGMPYYAKYTGHSPV